VQAFTRIEDLVGQMKASPFDGYIIDWVLGEGSAAELVGMIRADDRECPIAILTGRIEEDLMLEPVVAEAVSTYKLLFFEKPTRFSIISAALLPKLERR
jgi:DNA-binding response OmpR family regulator